MKIDLPIITYAPWNQPVVLAELVDVAPHIEGTFAVHRCHDKPMWKVTHVETGFGAGPDSRNKEVAIREARKCLKDKTPADFERAVIDAVERAPWIADPAAYPTNGTA